jgi:hypothetical protein
VNEELRFVARSRPASLGSSALRSIREAADPLLPAAAGGTPAPSAVSQFPPVHRQASQLSPVIARD